MNSTETLAAGLSALPQEGKNRFASTQTAGRFYRNETTTLNKLAEPLLEAAHLGVLSNGCCYALIGNIHVKKIVIK